MIPILYDKYEADFLSNGLGQLSDCLSCTVTEEVNGIYEVEFTYPMNGAYYEQLINYGGVIACTHDHNGDVQLFDIYKYDAPIDGIVTFYASHVSYRLRDYWRTTSDTYLRLSNLFNVWNNPDSKAILPLGNFQFVNELDYVPEIYFHGVQYNLREAMFSTSEDNPGGIGMMGIEKSIVQLIQGEWRFDNFTCYFNTHRGQDRGVQIRYGKNMSGVNRSRDTAAIVSAYMPVWTFENGITFYDPTYSPQTETDVSPWYANGEQVYSDAETFYFNPPIIHIEHLDISSDFVDAPTDAEAAQFALNYMRRYSTWKADDNITVEFLDLYGTQEYEGIQGLSDCRLGDYVSILYPQLGIVSNGVEILSLTYDVLADRVTEMQLNTIKTTLAKAIIDSIGGK